MDKFEHCSSLESKYYKNIEKTLCYEQMCRFLLLFCVALMKVVKVQREHIIASVGV